MNQINGEHVTESNGRPDDRRTGDRGSVFKQPDSAATELPLIELTEPVLQSLRQVPDPLPVPTEPIRQLAVSEQADGEQVVRQLAEALAETEPTRRQLATECRRVRAALKERLRTERQMRRRWSETKRSVPLLERIPSDNVPNIFTKKNFPAVVKLSLFVALFVWALVAEVSNMLFLVGNAGLFEGNYIAAFFFGSIYCIAPFLAGEFIKHDHNYLERLRWALRMKFIALPVTFIGMWLFAWKMGTMWDTVDPFAESSWEPQLWLTIGFTMLLLALSLMAVPSLMESAVTQLWPFSFREGTAFQIASRRVIAINAVLAEAAALGTQVDETLRMLDQDRRAFVYRCVALYRLTSAEAKAKREAIKASEAAKIETAKAQVHAQFAAIKSAESARIEALKAESKQKSEAAESEFRKQVASVRSESKSNIEKIPHELNGR